MKKDRKRALKALRASRAGRLPKLPPVQPSPAMVMAGKLMALSDPTWEAHWAKVAQLDAALRQLATCFGYSEGLNAVAHEIQEQLKLQRNTLEAERQSFPTLPQDWYHTSVRQPQDREWHGLGALAGIRRH